MTCGPQDPKAIVPPKMSPKEDDGSRIVEGFSYRAYGDRWGPNIVLESMFRFDVADTFRTVGSSSRLGLWWLPAVESSTCSSLRCVPHRDAHPREDNAACPHATTAGQRKAVRHKLLEHKVTNTRIPHM